MIFLLFWVEKGKRGGILGEKLQKRAPKGRIGELAWVTGVRCGGLRWPA